MKKSSYFGNIYVRPAASRPNLMPEVAIQDVTQLKSEIINKDKMIKDLKMLNETIKNELENKLKLMKEKNLDYENEKNVFEKKDAIYQEKLSLYKKQIEGLELEKKSLEETFADLKLKYSKAVAETEIQVERLKRQGEQIGILTESNKKYTKELQEIQDNLQMNNKAIHEKFADELQKTQFENHRLQLLLTTADERRELEIQKKIVANDEKHSKILSELKNELLKARQEYTENEIKLRVAQDALLEKEGLLSHANEKITRQKHDLDRFFAERLKLINEQQDRHVAYNSIKNTVEQMTTMRIEESDSSEALAIKELNKIIEDLTSKNTTLRQQILDEQGKDTINKTHILIKEKNIEENLEQIRNLNNEVSEYKRKFIEKDDEIKNLTLELSKAQVEIQKMERTISSLKSNVQVLENRVKTSQSTIDDKIYQMAQLNTEKNKYQMLYDEAVHRAQGASINPQLSSEILMLKEEIEKKNGEIHKLRLTEIQNVSNASQSSNEISILKEKLNRFEELEREYENLKETLNSQNIALEDKEAEINDLKGELDDLNQTIRELQNNTNLSIDDRENIQNQYHQTLLELANLKNSHNQLLGENQTLKSQIQNLETELRNVNFERGQSQDIINNLTTITKSIQEERDLVINKMNQERALVSNEELKISDLKIEYEKMAYYYDLFYALSQSHIVNINLYNQRYIEPFVKYVDSFHTYMKLFKTFSLNSGERLKDCVKKFSKKALGINVKRSHIRLSRYNSNFNKMQLSNSLNAYYECLNFVQLYSKNQIHEVTFDEVNSAYNDFFAAIQNFVEKVNAALNEITIPASRSALDVISGLTTKLQNSVEQIMNVMKANDTLRININSVTKSIIGIFNSVLKNNNTIKNVVYDCSNILQFSSINCNNVGKVGAELLMNVKNCMIEVSDGDYGKNRNELEIQDKNVIVASQALFESNKNPPLVNMTSPISHLYDIRNSLCAGLCKHLVQSQNALSLDRFEAMPITKDLSKLDVIFNYLIPEHKISLQTKNSTNPFIVNQKAYYFDMEAEKAMITGLNQIALTKKHLFMYLGSVFSRYIIKFENLLRSGFFISNIDINQQYSKISNTICDYIANFSWDGYLNKEDTDCLLYSKKLIFSMLSNISYITGQNGEQVSKSAIIKKAPYFLNIERATQFNTTKALDSLSTNTPSQRLELILNNALDDMALTADTILNGLKYIPTSNFSQITASLQNEQTDSLLSAKSIKQSIKELTEGKKNMNLTKADLTVKGFTNGIQNWKMLTDAKNGYFITTQYPAVDNSIIKSANETIQFGEKPIVGNLGEQEALEKLLNTGIKMQNDEFDDQSTDDEEPSLMKERFDSFSNLDNQYAGKDTTGLTAVDFDNNTYAKLRPANVVSQLSDLGTVVKFDTQLKNRLLNLTATPTGQSDYRFDANFSHLNFAKQQQQGNLNRGEMEVI